MPLKSAKLCSEEVSKSKHIRYWNNLTSKKDCVGSSCPKFSILISKCTENCLKHQPCY